MQSVNANAEGGTPSQSESPNYQTTNTQDSLVFARVVGSLGTHLESGDFSVGYANEGDLEEDEVAVVDRRIRSVSEMYTAERPSEKPLNTVEESTDDVEEVVFATGVA